MHNLPPIDALTVEDLRRLVADRVPEGIDLEYKVVLPGDGVSDKKEFVRDVTALANAVGGYLLFGIADARGSDGQATGVAGAVKGLPGGVNVGIARLRLEQLARDCVDPRLAGLRIREIPGGDEGPVIACWVPRSWQPPHMVTFDRDWKCYGRSSAGRYPLDITQIRHAVLAGEALTERLRRFRSERLWRIQANDAPVNLRDGEKGVLHVTPAGALSAQGGSAVPLHEVARTGVRPLARSSYNPRFNIDGWLGDGGSSYVQVFRDGCIETVACYAVEAAPVKGVSDDEILWPFADAASDYLNALAKWGIPGPWFVMLSLLGMKGGRLVTGGIPRGRLGVFDRDVIQVPEVMLEGAPPTTRLESLTMLAPAYDGVWQAAGFERCSFFDATGAWCGPSV